MEDLSRSLLINKNKCKIRSCGNGWFGVGNVEVLCKTSDTIYDEDEKDKWSDLNKNNIWDMNVFTRIYYYFKPEHPSVTFGSDIHLAEKLIHLQHNY